MRKIRARRAIAKVLLDNPEGITAGEIIVKLDPKVSLHSIIDARHVSNLLRGAKGVTKQSKGARITTANPNTPWKQINSYRVAVYSVSDAAALEAWVS